MDIGGPPKQPSPTGTLAWIGFGLSVFALASMCICFASPYWIQQWPLSFSTFENMGLWEACFRNYMHHRDDLQEIYNECFWVFDGAERFSKLRDWLTPPWFIACQVMSTAILLILLSVVIVTALVFLHMCPMMNHEYHQIFAMFISGAMLFLCTMTSLIVAIMFGVQVNDRNWMPRPDWNFLSWGFGFLVITGIMSFAAGLLLFMAAWRAYNKLMRLQDDYFKQAMEMSSAYPAGGYSQSSYGPGGYEDKPSYTDQPSYSSHPSYEKQSYDKPSYGPSTQSSYDKPSYGQSQSSYDKPGYGQSQSSYNGRSEKAGYQPSQQGYDASLQPATGYMGQGYAPQEGYEHQAFDGNTSYDSQQGYDEGYGRRQAYPPRA